MGRKSGQMRIIMINMEEMIPRKHLLRKIDQQVDFNFIYDEAAINYSDKGRPSVDPVCMIKMLLIGYLYGVQSERRLEEEVTLNIAYRWFCGYDLMDKVPDHSTFSQNRHRRFGDDGIFRNIFNQIVRQCIEKGLVSGEQVVSDGSFVPANVSWDSRYETIVEIEQSTVDYLDILNEEMEKTTGYVEPVPVLKEKTEVKSTTDLDCGYIHQERKKGLGYLAQMTVDTKAGIITGVDCYPANRRESDIVLKHVQRQMQDTGVSIKQIALDAGYDVGAVHRGFELLGITDFSSPRESHNNPMKKGFHYNPESDSFLCEKGNHLTFEKLIFKKGQGYYRLYQLRRKECGDCERLFHCAVDKGAIRINASPFYPAYHANRLRYDTLDYNVMKRLRSIWSEGTFAALKNNHNLRRHRKRGIHRASEECLLSALALNLKRMVQAA